MHSNTNSGQASPISNRNLGPETPAIYVIPPSELGESIGIESQEEIIDSSLEDSDISRDKTLPTALPYRQTNQLENQDSYQEKVPDIEYQDPSTPDGSKSPIQSNSESTDTIEIREPQTPRPNSYCSVYTIPADLFHEEELEVTSLSEEVTAIIQSRRNSINPETQTLRSRQNSITPTVEPEEIIISNRNSITPEILFENEEEPETEPEEDKPKMTETKSILKCIGVVTIPILVLAVAMMASSFHVVEEGHVGIYFKQGALQEIHGMPGFNVKAPFVTTVYQIVVRPETDTMDTIISITKDGIQNTFNAIQVISLVPQEKVVPLIRQYGMEFKNALVFDRIAEELKIYCAGHNIDDVYNTKFLEISPHVLNETRKSIERLSNGSVHIINLVIPKPDIPLDIAENYKQVKVQWTEQLVASQQQKTEEIRKETERMKAIADVNRTKDVLEVELQKELLQKEADRNVSEIQNSIIKLAEENLADIAKYKKEQEAEANKALYTPEYVQLNLANKLSDNTKMYFSGETSPLGALMDKILGN